jgi:hypothetical protein
MAAFKTVIAAAQFADDPTALNSKAITGEGKWRSTITIGIIEQVFQECDQYPASGLFSLQASFFDR